MGIVSAANYCCEKTKQGAWCQNVDDQTLCDSTLGMVSAFCDSTSYCKPGTCVNQQEGTCMPNTPQKVCDANNGFWSEKPKSELPQCQLGCCLIGDQAAFATQVSCNRMATLYGLDTDWRSNINNEIECVASANPSAKGACVYTENFVKTCSLTTKQDCQDKSKNSALGAVEFHEGFLCSATELGTDCAKTQNTKCEGDDVYFVDTCGNLGNIYDSSKINDENYWAKIQSPACTQSSNAGNKNSKGCGDCDYLSGSMCKQKKTGDMVDYGNFLCKDLDCKDYRGAYSGSGTGFATAEKYPKHGETWCVTDAASGNEYSSGSSYFRLSCYNGEVTKEECDSTREKICSEITDEISGFMVGNCKKNEWETCTGQDNSEDCNDANMRDCTWIEEKAGTSNVYYFAEGLKNDVNPAKPNGVCVPKYQPGFYRDGSSDTIINCGLATSVCYVKMSKALWEGDYKCDTSNPNNNCSCLDAAWQEGMNKICTSLGDCGNKKNFIGKLGKQYPDVIKIIRGNPEEKKEESSEDGTA